MIANVIPGIRARRLVADYIPDLQDIKNWRTMYPLDSEVRIIDEYLSKGIWPTESTDISDLASMHPRYAVITSRN